MEKCSKNTHSGHFRVTTQCVPVHIRGCTGTPCFVFPVSTNFCILAITYSFLIRFECFKWPIKIYFKENQT